MPKNTNLEYIRGKEGGVAPYYVTGELRGDVLHYTVGHFRGGAIVIHIYRKRNNF